jgi:hypothetical protein
MDTPMLKYLREVIDEHSIPLEDPNTVVIEAAWLIDMLAKVESVHKNDGE